MRQGFLMVNLVLCGGSGTRLWPISRTLMPKQFAKLFGDKSLFQLTLQRNMPYCYSFSIVSSVDQYFLARDQCEPFFSGWEHPTFVLEPIARNTAPAIALACMTLEEDVVVLVTPSDHLIRDEEIYAKALERAQILAQEGFMVTFGMAPHYPETGFGYIEAYEETVTAFHEKPDLQTAQKYLLANTQQTNTYYWNSGMFCFKVKTFLEELQLHAPQMYEMCLKASQSSIHEHNVHRITKEAMSAIPEESIDYAIMEKSCRVKVVAGDFGWSDVGSFDALFKEFPKDEHGNTQCQDHISINSHRNLIIANNRKIATIDIDDLLIIDTPDALMISKKGSSQKVKEVVAELKRRNTDIHNTHLTVHRPWGTYTVLEDTPGYKIKRIVVNPGKRLSLQKHFHRSEHWIVVSGSATVTVGEQTILVRPNESTYIQMGQIHRLANEGKIPVILIEAQVGEYTGEDDIVRIQDDFERVQY